MIARKIFYKGLFQEQEAETIYDITRKNEITGIVKYNAEGIELLLEGDPSMIKLIQHQIERRVSKAAQAQVKQITQIPYQNYEGIDFIRGL
jgi:hypothetical protein